MTPEQAAQLRAPCVFCDPHEVIGETPGFWAKLNLYPVSPGHALVIARRHVESFFDLSHAAVAEAFALLTVVRDDIGERLHPDGWNIAINDGRAAGRTIDHLHIHLIPRYLGDIEDPRGGLLNFLPGPSPDLWSTR